MKQFRRYLALMLALMTLLSFTGCATKPAEDSSLGGAVDTSEPDTTEESKRIIWRFSEGPTNYVRINTKGYGTMIVELYPEIAPQTVENFKALVKDGFYDKLTFHRIGKTVIQGGAPKDGSGKAEQTIKGEFSANGFENTLSHTRGVISMARIDGDYNSASCQFFICVKDSTDHDGEYAAFGKVIEGLDTLDKLSAVPTFGESPMDAPEIVSIRFVYHD